jgi:Xaa-Pro dipeptidase
MNIEAVKELLKQNEADAWIIVDYENRNPATVSLFGDKMLTRKLFIVIPLAGKPYLIVHTIDQVFLSDKKTLDRFDLRVYKTWKQMLELERKSFASYKTVMMDVSKDGLLPRVSLADFGSVDFIEKLGIRVISSADLLQTISAVYSLHAHQLQLKADRLALQIKDEAFVEIKKRIESDGKSDEYAIQQFIAKRFHEEGMTYDDPPIVAIGKNASNPHYGPTAETYSPILKGDLVLIDMWAKINDPEGVYADITWIGYVGKKVPAKYAKRFAIVKKAVDETISFLKQELPKRRVEGWEADDVARKVISEAGYGEYFVHRTGHNIAVDVGPHGSGANLDNYESHDTRALINSTSFSVEPGIYAPDFGIRSETNIYVAKRKPVVVAGRQSEIVPILG